MKEKIMPEDAIPPGKIKCFITGKLRKDTPEERVRQVVARALVEEYGYEKKDIQDYYDGKYKKKLSHEERLKLWKKRGLSLVIEGKS